LTQFHFHPDSYLAMARAEMPVYDELQQVVAEASGTGGVRRVLDIGAGTGETAAAVLHRHPGAIVWLLDESGDMLEAARQRLTPKQVEGVSVADMRTMPLDGEFDLVVSALAVHHLATADKRALFERVYDVLRPGRRFVLADVVVPDDPSDAVTPLSSDFDRPDTLDDLVASLSTSGFETEVAWRWRDLAVVTADRPA
jgi:tRNA (cmo5U34)-methyltransferase